MAANHSALDKHCVVIELGLVDEERILKYLYERVYSYNWISRQDYENGKVRLCVWWREDEWKLFCATPLRSFLKRLKNKAQYEKIEISRIMTTDDGIRSVCNNELECINHYYLDEPLRSYLHEFLSPDGFSRSAVALKNQKGRCNLILQTIAPMDISTKLDLLHKVTSAILPQARHQLQQFREEKTYQDPPTLTQFPMGPPSQLITEPPTLSEFPKGPPSPLIAEPADSPTYPILPDPPSPLITEPPDVFLPTFPSSPRTESYYSRSEPC